MNRYLFPLLGFMVIVGFLAVGLGLDPKIIPSPLIDKPAPDFEVPTLFDPTVAVSAQKLRGEVWLLNVWASWCLACRAEHPLIKSLEQKKLLKIVGLNYKDERPDAKKWLSVYGNPYSTIAYDIKGNVGIDYGVYGVPESFLIDKKGHIRFKQIGPFTQQVIDEELLPMVQKLLAES